MSVAEEIIARLNLQPHPREGGFFRETYRSPLRLPSAALGGRHDGDRCASTAIYYLLSPGTFSALHRLRGDEVFHFYAGSPVLMLQLEPNGQGREVVLGADVLAGEQPQVVVPGGVWQGSALASGGDFALLGCTVAPGFEYADYEHGRRADLLAQYPAHRERIIRLTLE
jgi:uncharacterized protein